jgi:hypothetical protein
MGDYVAKMPIQAPGTLVMAYQPGDQVVAAVVQEWGLNEEQVRMAEDYQAPRPEEDSDDRALWEAYVVGQGTDLESARAASLEELKDLYEAPPEPETPAWEVNDAKETQERVAAAGSAATPESAPGVAGRPADSANKADWIVYVINQGADNDWANASTTTKEDLKNWA